MKQKIKILHLEDSPIDAELVNRELKRGQLNPEILVVPNKSTFVKALKDFSFDVILSDHSLASFDSIEAVRMVKAAGITVPFILVTATMSDIFAAKIMKEGVSDYIVKDRLHRLPLAVVNLIEKHRFKEEKNADRIKTDKEFKQLTTRLQLATKSADMGIWEWDIQNGHLDWDDGMHQLYNISNLLFGSVYDGWISRIHAEDRQRVDEEIQTAVNGEKKYETEFRIVWPDGSIHTIKATGIVEKGTEGRPDLMTGANWDITEQKNAETDRIKMVNDLMLRNAELEQFGYIISHNLRAPVANIIGASSVLCDPGTSDKDKEMLNTGINASVIKLDNVVKDLNHILEIKGKINDTKEMVYFSALADDIKFSILNLIKGRDIEFRFDFSEVNEFFTLKAYLYSIFYNLISNSIKYRRENIHCVIEVKSRLSKNTLELTFKDNGLGIDIQQNGNKIFGLYNRFHTNIEGKGMGLFMVKTQVEALGGKISLKSRENEGTEVKIEFEL